MSIANKLGRLFTASPDNGFLPGLPTGAGPFPFCLPTLPSGWIWADGSVLLSNTAYTILRAALIAASFPYGQDGSGNPKVPDMRGRVPAGKDDMGGTAAGRLNVTLTGNKASTSNGVITGLSSTAGLSVGMAAIGTGVGAAAVINSIDSGSQVTLSVNSSSTGSTSIRFGVVDGATLGAAGGSHVHALSVAQIPAHTHSISVPANPSQVGYSGFSDNASVNAVAGATGDVSGSAGSSAAHSNLQPTMVLNYIIKT